MNEKNETQPMYPQESIEWLDESMNFAIYYGDEIESEDQLDSLLRDLKPALDAWINEGGYYIEDVVALQYSPPGSQHRGDTCTHLIPIVSKNLKYSFEEIDRQLSDPPNVIFDDAQLTSLEESGRTGRTGSLTIIIIPVEVWETLPTTDPALPLVKPLRYLHDTIEMFFKWLQAHRLPDGWGVNFFLDD